MISKLKLILFLFAFQTGLCQEPNDTVSNDSLVSFYEIEQPPLFPSCETLDLTEQNKCFQEALFNHVKKNFSYPQKAVSQKIEGRVFISFIIEKDGSITIDKVKGSHEILEQEAVRIIISLPKLSPGKIKNQKVRVKYSMPITFKLQ